MTLTSKKIRSIDEKLKVTSSKMDELAIQQQEQGDKLNKIDRELNTLERDGEKDERVNELNTFTYLLLRSKGYHKR